MVPSGGTSNRLGVALPYLCLLFLGFTLLVYPTPLNPGLPLILSGLLAVAVGTVRAWKGSGRYYHPAQDVAFGLMLWLVLSLAIHRTDLYLGQRSLYTFVGAVAFLGGPQVGVVRGKQMRRFMVALVVFLGLVSLFAWVEELPKAYVSGHLDDFKGRFANPDVFSLIPLAGFCLGMGLLERASKKVALWYCALISFQYFTLAATGCRAAILGSVFGVALFLGATLGYRSKEFEQTRHLVLVPIALGLLVLGASAYNFAAVTKYAGSLSGDTLKWETTRFEVDHYGWLAAARNPLMGGGPGSFGLVYQAVRPAGHDELYVDIAHNDYIEMAVEGGFPALLAWVALQVLVLAKLLYCVRKGKRPFLAAAIAAAIVSLMAFSLFNFILPERPVLWLFFLLLGLGASFPSSRRRYTELAVVRYLGALLLVLGGGASIVFGWRSVLAEKALVQASVHIEALAKEQAYLSLEQASRLQPNRADTLLDMAEQAKGLYLFSGDAKWRDRRFEALKKAVRVSPLSVLPYLRLAGYYLEDSELESAEKNLVAADKLAPYRDDVQRKIVSLKILQGDPEGAVELLSTLPLVPGGEDYNRIRVLLETWSQKSPDALAGVLNSWREDSSNAVWMAPLLAELLEDSLKSERWNAAGVFVKEALYYQPNDLCLELAEAKVAGAQQGAAAERALLKKLAEGAESLSGDCAKKVVDRYLQVLDSQDSAEARRFLEERIRMFPRSAAYRLWLSERLRKAGQPLKARDVLRKGLDEGASSAELLYQLGELYLQGGSDELAIGYYRQALQLDPNHAESKKRLGELIRPTNKRAKVLQGIEMGN